MSSGLPRMGVCCFLNTKLCSTYSLIIFDPFASYSDDI